MQEDLVLKGSSCVAGPKTIYCTMIVRNTVTIALTIQISAWASSGLQASVIGFSPAWNVFACVACHAPDLRLPTSTAGPNDPY